MLTLLFGICLLCTSVNVVALLKEAFSLPPMSDMFFLTPPFVYIYNIRIEGWLKYVHLIPGCCTGGYGMHACTR